MSYRLGLGKPSVSVDIDNLEKGIATYIDSRGWTTNTQFRNGVDALTDSQALAAFKAFVKAIIRVE